MWCSEHPIFNPFNKRVKKLLCYKLTDLQFQSNSPTLINPVTTLLCHKNILCPFCKNVERFAYLQRSMQQKSEKHFAVFMNWKHDLL